MNPQLIQGSFPCHIYLTIIIKEWYMKLIFSFIQTYENNENCKTLIYYHCYSSSDTFPKALPLDFVICPGLFDFSNS